MLDAKRYTLTLYMHVYSDSDIEHYAIMHTKKIKLNKKNMKQRQTSAKINIKISIRILLGITYKKIFLVNLLHLNIFLIAESLVLSIYKHIL